LIYCVKDALLVLLLPAAVGSFSFAAIQRAIKKPCSWLGGGSKSAQQKLHLIEFYK
jgi:hypothetical protein